MLVTMAAIGFRNGDTEFNKKQIMNAIAEYAKRTDLILFGEGFLQGFDSLDWNFEHDRDIAIARTGDVIEEIALCAAKNNVAVSFGYFELDGKKIYSSQLVIDKSGTIIHNYRRKSVGWKIKLADHHYKEGSCFSSCDLNERKFTVGLCGDLWCEKNIDEILSLEYDMVLWPIYVDYNSERWNKIEKYKYAEQANKLNGPILCVNSFCMDNDDAEIAKGGAALFFGGKIEKEIPSGKEGCLTVEI